MNKKVKIVLRVPSVSGISAEVFCPLSICHMTVTRVIATGTLIISAWLVASFFYSAPVTTENLSLEMIPTGEVVGNAQAELGE